MIAKTGVSQSAMYYCTVVMSSIQYAMKWDYQLQTDGRVLRGGFMIAVEHTSPARSFPRTRDKLFSMQMTWSLYGVMTPTTTGFRRALRSIAIRSSSLRT